MDGYVVGADNGRRSESSMPNVTHAHPHQAGVVASLNPTEVARRALLVCGMAGAALYPVADILAAARYPGFSYRDQAVSELFAIGAPTSAFLVPLFSASSTGILLLSAGIWMTANGRRLGLLAIACAERREVRAGGHRGRCHALHGSSRAGGAVRHRRLVRRVRDVADPGARDP
jgi:hypothetical protein